MGRCCGHAVVEHSTTISKLRTANLGEYMEPELESHTDLTPKSQESDSESPVESESLVEDELLVEEISIDGMCGVY